MKARKTIMVAITALAGLLPARAAQAIEVSHLGVNNTLVRVEPTAKYLLIPVQDSKEDARINVLVDGKLDRTIMVRLAQTKVDFKVPFDLTPYRGHNVVLDIVAEHGRGSVREAADEACWQNFALADTFECANTEKYRPAYHHTPLWGWMNDPNGMFYKDGVWHLCYQWNPYGSKWQNLSWGQSTSRDLINWEHHPVAVEPNGLGLIFSGSCALDPEGTAGFGKDAVVAMWTSCATSQMQSLGWSNNNGETFNVYAANPVITLPTEARDPNMFFNHKTGLWTLVLAHALEHEMLIFTSPDMKTWTRRSAFGKVAAQDGVWECPDLFELPVPGNDATKWVLLCNLNPGGPFGGSATQYFIGDFDGTTFTADTDASGNIPTKWLDYGKDHYATVSFSDAPAGRRTVIGWMSNWQYAPEVPTLQFRSANTLPREMKLFRGDDGQLYVASEPSPELLALRGRTVRSTGFTGIDKQKTYQLPAENDGICEICLDLNTGNDTVDIDLCNEAGDKVTLTYNPADRTLSLDRRYSGITDFSQSFPAVTAAPILDGGDRLALRIFVDRSSIEVFANNGHAVLTDLVFPTKPYSTLAMQGKGTKASTKIYAINPTQI